MTGGNFPCSAIFLEGLLKMEVSPSLVGGRLGLDEVVVGVLVGSRRRCLENTWRRCRSGCCSRSSVLVVLVSRSSLMLMKLGLVRLRLWSIFMMMVSLSRLSSMSFIVVVHMMLGGDLPFMTMCITNVMVVAMEMWTWTTCACIAWALRR